MTDLRKAAEMALEALEGALSDDQPYIEKSKKAAEALRQALAQPEQVLTAKMVVSGSEHKPWCDSVTKLLLSMPPQIPPCNCKPKREWVGLTDEEKQEWIDAMPYDPQPRHCMTLVNIIESKLKEKNT